MQPNDTDLTLTTLDVTANQGRILILACGALAREILDILKLNDFQHIDLKCLPAIYHNTPEKIVPAVREIVTRERAHFEKIAVAYADCGTGGLLQAACDDMGIEMIKGPHCYSFFEGNAAFEQRDELTAFYLTDFLARQFDAFVWKPLGLDRHPELLSMYFGHYTTLVYQSQVHDPAMIDLAKSHADRMGLAFEHRHTGYGDLDTHIKVWAR